MSTEGGNVYQIDAASARGTGRRLTAVGSEPIAMNAETLATDIMRSYVRRVAGALGLPWDDQNDEELQLFVQCLIEATSARSAALLESVMIDVRKLLDAKAGDESASELRESP